MQREKKMAKISNIFGTTFKGRVGRKMVAGTWKGHEYIRPYVKPSNPKTEAQRAHRELFSSAVKTWQGLSGTQQAFYNRIASGMTGFNLFVKRTIPALENELVPEVPIPMQWKTEDGKPVTNGKLIVLQAGQQIFNDSLKDAKGEVALTPSDAPYTFVLRKGTEEDVVLTIRDLGSTNVPMTLESKKLGIKLVADVEAPQREPTPVRA
jgi:hypothetical protein